MNSQGLYINGTWASGQGAAFSRLDPTDGTTAWQGNAASREDIDAAVTAAQAALPGWSGLSMAERLAYLDAFGRAVTASAKEILAVICLETGKPRWESKTEVDALSAKIDLTKRAAQERAGSPATTKEGVTSATRYRPLGIVAVLGPFNLPAHLPNGHILPALLAGNTVVFKPSEFTPGVGEIYTRCWQQAGLPPGVFNLVQGAREAGTLLTTHPGIHGVLFTGSRTAGVAISTALAAHPEILLALEMGGNNPLVATQLDNIDAAACTILQSAFITAGQRCTCARRLILLRDAEADSLLERLIDLTAKIKVGPHHLSPEPFIGPVISDAAAQHLLNAQTDLQHRGAVTLQPLHSLGRPAMLAPGILDVTAVANRSDEEFFGPLLQVIRVPDIDAAIAEANNTRFGLAAGLLSRDAALYERFHRQVRAGIINWNRPTTGASSSLPFGGVGLSGNHRPAGYSSIDYCWDPVAFLESASLTMPALPPGITL